MDLIIKDYNPAELYNKVFDALSNQCNELSKKYKYYMSDCRITVIPYVAYTNFYYEQLKHFKNIDITSNFIEHYTTNAPTSGTIATTLFSGFYTDGTPALSVYFIYERIIELIFLHLADIEELIKHFKNSLIHEIGHVIHFKQLIEECNYDMDKFMKIYNNMCEQQNILYKELIKNVDDITKEEFSRKYNSLPLEEIANKNVGLTWEDLLF